jgi:LmbE family N-acetylglucosaminyl deacetylase
LPHWNDGHSDHDAAHELAKEAASKVPEVGMLYQYMIWKPWLHPLYRPQFLRELGRAVMFDVADVLAEKNVAIQAYASQLATLPRGFLDRFLRSYELFFPSRNQTGHQGATGAGKEDCK